MMLENGTLGRSDAFSAAIERYLAQTLHGHFLVNVFASPIALPVFIRRNYKLYESLIAGRRCIFLAAGEKVGTPADIGKHIELVRSTVVDAVIVFATRSLSASSRSRFIAQNIPFVVPGNQLYIPQLAMDLRDYFRTRKPRAVDGFSPAAQAVLFHHMLRLDALATTPSVVAKRLHYSAMSIGRAFDDLVAAGLAQAEKQGKEKHLHFIASGRRLFDLCRPLLRSPVRTIKFVRNGPFASTLKRAGESALSELTNLSRPKIETFAVAANSWKALKSTQALVEVNDGEGDYALETWSYEPAGLSDGPTVDPLSLYVQYSDHPDERLSIAAGELLEQVPW